MHLASWQVNETSKASSGGTIKHIHPRTYELSSAPLQGFLLHQEEETRLPRLPERRGAITNPDWAADQQQTGADRGKKAGVCVCVCHEINGVSELDMTERNTHYNMHRSYTYIWLWWELSQNGGTDRNQIGIFRTVLSKDGCVFWRWRTDWRWVCNLTEVQDQRWVFEERLDDRCFEAVWNMAGLEREINNACY